MNSHRVEISIAGCVGDMVCGPTPKSQECPYIEVLPSALILYDSYSVSHDS